LNYFGFKHAGPSTYKHPHFQRHDQSRAFQISRRRKAKDQQHQEPEEGDEEEDAIVHNPLPNAQVKPATIPNPHPHNALEVFWSSNSTEEGAVSTCDTQKNSAESFMDFLDDPAGHMKVEEQDPKSPLYEAQQKSPILQGQHKSEAQEQRPDRSVSQQQNDTHASVPPANVSANDHNMGGNTTGETEGGDAKAFVSPASSCRQVMVAVPGGTEPGAMIQFEMPNAAASKQEPSASDGVGMTIGNLVAPLPSVPTNMVLVPVPTGLSQPQRQYLVQQYQEVLARQGHGQQMRVITNNVPPSPSHREKENNNNEIQSIDAQIYRLHQV
jgi:hypothetical protein